ncbi:MAG TPA: ParA family protein [Candidatus Saccharimonadia bacterium]|nr:ParA family protein [Candidatus Saccharimonadia bacterium]
MAKIIAIANQKGGVGKTTTTINLGAYLAEAKKSVLIVDLDPQGNTSSGLGISTDDLSGDLYDVLMDGVAAEAVARETAVKGLSILPASPVLAAAEVELVAATQREFKLRSAISELPYDYVLIDCPPSLGILTVNGLVAAHELIIPVQAEFYAMEGLGQLVQTVQRVRKGLNPELRLMGVLVTMHNGRTTLSSQVHEEVKRHFPDTVFETVIPRNVRLAEAPSFGKPIMHYDGWSKGARSYKALAKEVEKRAGMKK